MKRAVIIETISAIFIFLFVYTALNKFYYPDKFKWALGKSPLIAPMATIIAWVLPSVELCVAALLFVPRTRKLGLYGSFLMMTIFTIYISYMIVFTPKLPCSCGGILQQMTWKQHLIFNILFTCLAYIAIRLKISGDSRKANHQGWQIVYT